MKKIYESNNEIIYVTGTGKDIILRKGDKINLNFVLDFDIEVLEGEKGKALAVKDVRLKRNERIERG